MLQFLSRRTFLIAAGGGVSASLVWSCRSPGKAPRQGIQPDPAFDRFDKYMDDRGWMLDAKDRKLVRPA